MNRLLSLIILPTLVLFVFAPNPHVSRTSAAPPSSLILAITGGTLIDGSGRVAVKGAVVLINGDRIETVGMRSQVKIPSEALIADARGLVVAPGFIDTHNHSDRGLDDDPSAATQVSQGITTVAVGQDGDSAFPVGEYLTKLDRSPVALNVLTFVGHATLRSRVLGENTARPATTSEIKQMQALVEQGMRDGAFGLSTRLEYEIGKPATTEEVIALAQVAGRFGGIYFYQQPWVMVSSDGGIGSRHPRGAGTYPRVLGRYVRELHWLTLQEAIRKMTSLPASRLRLTDRGQIRAGFKADVVLFDPTLVIDRSTFREPQLISEGIKRVFVNGVEVWSDGAVTGKRPGRALRHPVGKFILDPQGANNLAPSIPRR